jgi:hemolysin III
VDVPNVDEVGGELAVGAAAVRVKPRLRGVFHEAGFYVAVGLAIPLIATAEAGLGRVAASIFALSVATCFGVSALYHRPTWRPRPRSWLARLDHAGIYLLIAGTYTPVCLLVMSAGWRSSVLAIVWSGAGAAILLKFLWLGSPKWLAAGIAMVLGWVAVVALGQLLKVGFGGLLLLLLGGLFYSTGALVYAFRRPDPAPRLFGYHEIFHLLTLAAVGCQYAAIAFYVLPRA